MAGRYKLDRAQIQGGRSSDGKRKRGGEREGTETHPIEALAGLEAVGTGAAGGRQ
jgi:hypothetical protein